MDPQPSGDDTTEQYLPHSSSSPPEAAAAAAAAAEGGGGGGGEGGGGGQTGGEAAAEGGGSAFYMYTYQCPVPVEEQTERPPAYHMNQVQQVMDEPLMQEPAYPPYIPFMVFSNLRTQLYMTLEKNTWMEKRISELEEERNFLRCQLDRFIVSMRTPEEWRQEPQHPVKEQPPSPPSTSSPMTTRSGMTLKRLPKPRPRRATAIPVKQEFHLEEDKYYTEDQYMEEEDDEDDEDDEEDSPVEKGSKRKSKGRGQSEPRMKMRRIFRITHSRERQRVKDPEGVLIRYKKILSTYQRVRSMSRAFQIHGVDRNTMASTSPIAELLLVSPEKVEEIGEFESSKEKLLDYARRCYRTMDEQTHAKVQTMKKTHKLLPISYRFRN